MTDTELQTSMDNKYPIKQFLLENDAYKFLLDLREAKGYLAGLYDVQAITEEQLTEWIDFLSDAITEWSETHD